MKVTSNSNSPVPEDVDLIMDFDEGDEWEEFRKVLPQSKLPLVDLANIPSAKRYSYEFAAEISGCSINEIKAGRVFELFVPLNPRPKDQVRNGNAQMQFGSFPGRNSHLAAQLERSPPKLSFQATSSINTFNTTGIQPVPMSPSINEMMLTGNLPTHSTPSLSSVGANLAATVTRHSKEQVELCRRNFSSHNQTVSLDSAVGSVPLNSSMAASTTMVIANPDDEVEISDDKTGDEDPSPALKVGKKGEKLNRTFTKEDLILMKQQGANQMDLTVNKGGAPEGATSEEESESLSCGHTETLTSSSSAEFQNKEPSRGPTQASGRAQPQIVDQQPPVVPLQPKQTAVSSGISRPSGLPAPSFSSRLMQPKVYKSNPQMGGSNPSLVGSASSLNSTGSKGNEDSGGPPTLQRAGTFTKEQRVPTASTNVGPSRKQSLGVLPNKMTAPSGMSRTSMAPQMRRNNTTGSNLNQNSLNVRAVRYSTASSRPSTAGGRR